ncbi:helix-turn-helix domain-containing protein [Trueperella pyogenes]
MWMRRKGVMQMELAPALGITAGVVSRKIAGRTTWSVEDLVNAARFLDVPISELLPESAVEVGQKKLAPNSSESEANLSRLWESNPRPSHYE